MGFAPAGISALSQIWAWDETNEVWRKVLVDSDGNLTVSKAGTAAGGVGNYSGVLQTYQTVVTWTVTAGKVGELKEILIVTDDYDHTEIQITIAGVVWCTGWSPTSAMPIIFEDLRLAAAAVVLVEAQSDDGTAIDVDAIIVAKEIG